jgi:hypothetical protein
MNLKCFSQCKLWIALFWLTPYLHQVSLVVMHGPLECWRLAVYSDSLCELKTSRSVALSIHISSQGRNRSSSMVTFPWSCSTRRFSSHRVSVTRIHSFVDFYLRQRENTYRNRVRHLNIYILFVSLGRSSRAKGLKKEIYDVWDTLTRLPRVIRQIVRSIYSHHPMSIDLLYSVISNFCGFVPNNAPFI